MVSVDWNILGGGGPTRRAKRLLAATLSVQFWVGQLVEFELA